MPGNVFRQCRILGLTFWCNWSKEYKDFGVEYGRRRYGTMGSFFKIIYIPKVAFVFEDGRACRCGDDRFHWIFGKPA